MTKWKLLVDGDVVAYKAAAAAEQPVCWDPQVGDDWSLFSYLGTVRDIIDETMHRMQENLRSMGFMPGQTKVYLSDSKNFRHEVWPEYKANRRGQRKPVNLPQAREYLVDAWGAENWLNLEADDVIGIQATTPECGPSVICSTDKDFRNIPEAWLWDPWGDEVPYFTDNAEAEEHFLSQCIAGDHVDGYSGVPGLGMKRAQQWLGKHGLRWESVVGAYEKAGLTEEDALVTARLAHILHWGDYNEDTGVVDLWRP